MPKITADKASFKHPKFAPLTLDFTFKKAFANEQSTELLLFLLNTFLKRVLKKTIIEVKIIHTVQLGRTIKKRGAVFDIQCEDASGARFIVEMQVEEQKHFIKRSLFYLCMAVANTSFTRKFAIILCVWFLSVLLDLPKLRKDARATLTGCFSYSRMLTFLAKCPRVLRKRCSNVFLRLREFLTLLMRSLWITRVI